MSGKLLAIVGAIVLAVFTVALDKYWETPFVQGIFQFFINIPTALQEPVGVPLWLVIVAVLVFVGVVIAVSMSVTERKLELLGLISKKVEREGPNVEPVYESLSASVGLPMYVTSDQKRILSFLGYAEENESMASLRNLSKTVNLSKLKCDYALQQLQKYSLVLIYKGSEHELEIMLTPKGKEFVVTNGVLTEWRSWLEYT
ncbi:hypothetical protein V8U11_15955 [Pseudomonas chlororaphis]|uniref:hypothetical protein n=1 Tax=Pseudomonas chlororaphis TaxID=587753 RepID=UPI0030D25AB9